MNYLKFIILFFLSVQLYAQKTHKILQKKQVKFDHISPEAGLTENSIQAIIQDSQGFMWFGTPNGLYKYDGYNFTVFRNNYINPFSLSENSITYLFEDSEELLWIGTEEDLNILDRKTGKFYNFLNSYHKQENSNNDLTVHSITEDDNGTFWVGTNNGLYKVKKNKDVPFSLSFRLISFKKKQYNTEINALLKRYNNEILVGTSNGIRRISPELDAPNLTFNDSLTDNTPIINDIPQFNNLAINFLYEDATKTTWVGTENGLYTIIYNEFSNTEIIKKINLRNYTNQIESIAADDNGKIWLGTTNDGLISLDTKNNKIEQFKTSIRPKTTDLKSNSILNLYKDNSGVLWIGTSRGGLNSLDLFKKNFFHFNNNPDDLTSLRGNIVNSFYEENNQEVWIGTFNNGLNKLMFKNGKIVFKNFPLNKDNTVIPKVFSICKDNYGYLWVATSNQGLYKLKLDKKFNIIESTNYTVKSTNNNLPTNNLNILYKDKIGDIWMGSFIGTGLMKFRPDQKTDKLPKVSNFVPSNTENYSLSSNKLSAIFEDKKGILWVGTKRGLNKVFRGKNNEPTKIIQYTTEKNNSLSLSNNNVFSIQEDSAGTIWIGTFGGGLNKMINEETNGNISTHFMSFSEKDGLASNAVYGVIEDDNKNLWISTNNGISRFNLKTETFKNYNISDGIQDRNFRKFAYHKGPTNLLYFGGINGFNVFHPDNITDHLSLPKTVITDLKIFNKSVNVTDSVLGKEILTKTIPFTEEIELNYSYNSFSFEFASLHYVSPEQNKYAYKLEGYDDDWIYTDAKRRFATYSNLDFGNYVFKVKSANKDGFWNEDSADINISILPPIWKTWWMYSIYALILFSLMWGFRFFILEKEKYNSQIKLQKFEQEKIKEVHKMKLQFFTNVSHEFKTPLTLILGPLEKLIASNKTNDSVKEMLVLMQRNANQLYKLIQQVLEFRKIENNELKLSVSKIDIVNFCKELASSFEVLASEKNITILFESNNDEFIDWFDFDKLEKIFNNLMSNALKFTPKNGEIAIKISVNKSNSPHHGSINLKNNNVEIIVKDTGQGIPLDKISLIFKRFYQVNSLDGDHMGSGVGLALTKSLVELHKGEILVSSKIKKGTKFIVRLPIGVNYSNIDHKDNEFLAENELIEDAVFEPELPESPSQNEEEELANSKLPLLLIVEDQKDMRTFIKSLLSETYEIIEAADGLEGKKMALENVPDLIISDVMMPKMNGKELCIELKNNEITNHI
ncbi:MAG: response regulator, partial [Bacteroidetes bacterium]|nr:response regulator [Bacteroidota bacterium]